MGLPLAALQKGLTATGAALAEPTPLGEIALLGLGAMELRKLLEKQNIGPTQEQAATFAALLSGLNIVQFPGNRAIKKPKTLEELGLINTGNIQDPVDAMVDTTPRQLPQERPFVQESLTNVPPEIQRQDEQIPLDSAVGFQQPFLEMADNPNIVDPNSDEFMESSAQDNMKNLTNQYIKNNMGEDALLNSTPTNEIISNKLKEKGIIQPKGGEVDGKIMYHSTTQENAKDIAKSGFKAQVGDRSLGITKGKGVWLYDNPDYAKEFGKNFKNPTTIETKVKGKIFDATNDDRSIRAIAEDNALIRKLKAEGYVGIIGDELGANATFIFDQKALSQPKGGELSEKEKLRKELDALELKKFQRGERDLTSGEKARIKTIKRKLE